MTQVRVINKEVETIRHVRFRSNENKISYGYRRRASIEV
jgi:hypothetical protein